MEPEPIDAGFELIKYILLFGSLPLWGPFAKALWEEFTLALRPDGGLAGHELTRKERTDIEDQIARTEDPTQVHEPIAHLRTQGAPGPQAQTKGLKPENKARLGPQAGGQRRAFTTKTGAPARQGNAPRFR